MLNKNVWSSAGRVGSLLFGLSSCFEDVSGSETTSNSSTSGGSSSGVDSETTESATTGSTGALETSGSTGTTAGMQTSGSEDTGSASSGISTSTGGSTGESCAAPLEFCNGQCVDIQSDDAHCGGCGNACNMFDGIGGCGAGTCLPAPTECFSNNAMDCNFVCLIQGLSCAENACGGNGVWKYFSEQDCEDNTFTQGGGVYTTPCSGVNHSEPWIRCCCE